MLHALLQNPTNVGYKLKQTSSKFDDYSSKWKLNKHYLTSNVPPKNLVFLIEYFLFYIKLYLLAFAVTVCYQ